LQILKAMKWETDMPADSLRNVFTFRTLAQVWTAPAFLRVGTVHLVPVPFRQFVGQKFMIGTDVGIVVLIVDIVVFFEESFVWGRVYGTTGRMPSSINNLLM